MQMFIQLNRVDEGTKQQTRLQTLLCVFNNVRSNAMQFKKL